MLKQTILLTLLVIFLFTLILIAGDNSQKPIDFIKYDEAMKIAEKDGRHVLIHFTAKWCTWCKRMKATTYKNELIVETINKNFVVASVDGDSYDVLKLKDGDITEKGLTKQFDVKGYPTTWFLEPDGKKIAPISGYLDHNQMQFILDYVATNSNETMSFPEFVAQEKKSKPGSSSDDTPKQIGSIEKSQSKDTAKQAPGFMLENLAGELVDFEKFSGKVVLVDFWATWCPPCRKSIPHLVELQQQYANKGFEVVGISLDQGGKGKVQSFVEKQEIPYTILMGNPALASDWKVGSGIPVAFLVDRSGKIVHKFVGYKPKAVFEKEIQKYI